MPLSDSTTGKEDGQQETQDIMSDPDLVRAIHEGSAEKGSVPLEAVKKKLAKCCICKTEGGSCDCQCHNPPSRSCKHEQVRVDEIMTGTGWKTVRRFCTLCGTDVLRNLPSEWIGKKTFQLMQEVYGSDISEDNFDYHSSYDHYRLHAIMDYLDSHAH